MFEFEEVCKLYLCHMKVLWCGIVHHLICNFFNKNLRLPIAFRRTVQSNQSTIVCLIVLYAESIEINRINRTHLAGWLKHRASFGAPATKRHRNKFKMFTSVTNFCSCYWLVFTRAPPMLGQVLSKRALNVAEWMCIHTKIAHIYYDLLQF